MEKRREYIFDILRILSMFLVLVVHVSNYYMRRYSYISFGSYIGGSLFNTLARVCVPVFFMISGALLLSKKYSFDNYKKRVLKFVYILLFWSFIYIIWDKYFLNQDINVLTTGIRALFHPVKAHLWFMYAIIGLYITLPFAQVLVNNMDRDLENLFIKLWLFFSGGIYILRVVFSQLEISTSIQYPIPFIQATYFLGYFISGYIIYNRLSMKKDAKKHNKKIVFFYLTSTLITFAGTVIMSFIKDEYFQSLFAYRSLFLITSSVTLFSLCIINKDKITSKLNNNLILDLTKYSFGIYLVHVIILNLLTNSLEIVKVSSFIGIPFFSFLIFIISYIIIKFISKIKYLKEFI